MKLLLYTFFISIIFLSACEKEEESRLESFNAEAFAFDLGGSWEVNASARVKGFKQTELNKEYSVSLAYDIDIVTPEGDTLKSLVSRVEDKISNEKLTDIPLDVQFELDSTYSPGNYTLIFIINDPETGRITSSSADFEL